MNTPVVVTIRIRAIVKNIKLEKIDQSIKVSRALIDDIGTTIDIEDIRKEYSDMIRESCHMIFIFLCIGAIDEALVECSKVMVNLCMTDKVASYIFLKNIDSVLPYEVRHHITTFV